MYESISGLGSVSSRLFINIAMILLMIHVVACTSSTFGNIKIDDRTIREPNVITSRPENNIDHDQTVKRNDPYKFSGAIPTSQYIVMSRSDTSSGMSGILQLKNGTGGPYGNDISQLLFTVTYMTDSIVHIKITDKDQKRWQADKYVLNENLTNLKKSAVGNKYQVTIAKVGEPFYLTIRRSVGQSAPIFDTTNRPFIFSDQYISIGTALAPDYYGGEPNIYGLGERIDSFRLNITDNEFIIWNNDNGNSEKMNLYGSHPFYLYATPNSEAHGVFLLNSNAMSIRTEYHSSAKYLQYQTIGGVLDFYFFLGPSSENVIQQYHSIIGKPHFPPMWAFGFHQCRWGYRTLDEVKAVVQGYDNNQLPLDAMWTDIDYMYQYWDFTFDPTRFPINDVRNFVTNDLKQKGRKYVVIVDPGIPIVDLTKNSYEPYELGLSLGIFIKQGSSNSYVNHTVWPGNCYFPDFSNPICKDQYWKPLIHGFLSLAGVGGLWIDMNEPATLDFFIPNQNSLNYPPFVPGASNEPLFHKTIDLDSRMSATTHYNAHNLYGFLEAKATAEALKTYYNKRPFVLTRSSFAGSGHYVSHWTGDNDSTFESMKTSIASILLNSMFGFAHVGSDIGGFNGDTTKELLIRWMQLGSLYPFSRNHNAIGNIPQEPFAFDQQTTDISRKYLLNRYSLLPYIYTTHALVHMNGGVAAKPLFFAFPYDKQVYSISEQFLFGDALLVSPVLYYQQTMVHAYFPSSSIWYDYYGGQQVSPGTDGYADVNAPLDTMPIHIRGGYIIPKQTPGLSTVQQKFNPYNLVVALDSSQKAQGFLFLDDGESIDSIESGNYAMISFNSTRASSSQYVIQATPVVNGYTESSKLSMTSIMTLGVQGRSICSLSVNGQPWSWYGFESNIGRLFIQNLSLSLSTSWKIVFETC